MTISKEDYLRVLLLNEQKGGVVYSKDIAEKLNVSRASVSRMMNVLKQKGLIEKEKYGYIILTIKGRENALKIERKRDIVKSFLIKVLKLDEKTADTEACKMEHALSSSTAEKLKSFTDNLNYVNNA